MTLGNKIIDGKLIGKGFNIHYAFDYNSYTWFYLGTISDTGSRDVMLRTQGMISDTDLRNLNSNGLLFKVVPTAGLKTDAIPNYWDKDYNAWQ